MGVSSGYARVKAVNYARDLALMEFGYPARWNPGNGELAWYAGLCGKCGGVVIVPIRATYTVYNSTIEIINSTIDIRCPHCDKAILALRAFPEEKVAKKYIETLLEELKKNNEP